MKRQLLAKFFVQCLEYFVIFPSHQPPDFPGHLSANERAYYQHFVDVEPNHETSPPPVWAVELIPRLHCIGMASGDACLAVELHPSPSLHRHGIGRCLLICIDTILQDSTAPRQCRRRASVARAWPVNISLLGAGFRLQQLNSLGTDRGRVVRTCPTTTWSINCLFTDRS